MKNKNLNELDDRLQERLGHLQEAPARDPLKAAGGRASYLALAVQISHRAPVSKTLSERLKGWTVVLFQPPTIKEQKLMWTTLATFFVTLTLLFGGAGATVYAAQDSLPTDLLYPLKTMSEDVRLGIGGSQGEQFNLALAFANKRVEEIEALKYQGEPLGEPLQTRLQEQMNLALQLMAGMSDEEIVPALIRTRTQLRTQLQTMEMLRTNFPDDVDPLMVQIQATLRAQNRLVEEGLENPLTFRQQYRSWAGNGEPGHGEPATTQEPQGPGNGAGPGPQVTQPPVPPGENGQGPGPQVTQPPLPPGPPENSGNGPQPEQPGQGPGPGPDNEPPQGGQGDGPGSGSPGSGQEPGSGGQNGPTNPGSGSGSGSGSPQGSSSASSPVPAPPASGSQGSGSTASGSSGGGK